MINSEYMNRIQLYLENSVQKYPLEDDTSGDIAKDILLDMSITTPAGTAMYLTNLVRTDQYLFVSIENDSGAVAHFFTAAPTQFRMNQMVMHMDGYGWIVFGPGVNGRFRHELVRERIDSRCILPNQRTVRQFKLEINGVSYDMPSVLNVLVNDFIGVSRQTRQISPSGGDPCACFRDDNPALPHSADFRECLVLRRNDIKLSDSMIKQGLTLGDTWARPLFTINNMAPDKNGNIDLFVATQDAAVESAWLVPMRNHDEDPIGFMLATRNMNGCRDEYARLMQNIRKSDTGEGTPYALPLDCVFASSGSECPETYPSTAP